MCADFRLSPLPSRPLRIGTRGSRLARWQADHVAERLRSAHPGLAVELIVVQSSGDLDRQTPLHEFGQTGVFTKELEAALLDDRVDVAVHSLKDLPTALLRGLTVRAMGPRADPRDVLASHNRVGLDQLRKGAVIGTGSIRRASQLRALRADLQIVPIRGNVETRLSKMSSAECDAVILALAGLARLNLAACVTEVFDIEELVPAPGQGILGLQWRESDAGVTAALDRIRDPRAEVYAAAERAFLRETQAGCHAPVGAIATFGDEPWADDLDAEDVSTTHESEEFRDLDDGADMAKRDLRLLGFIGSPDGKDVYFGETHGDAATADELGRALAHDLLRAGAAKVLAKLAAKSESRPPA